MNTHGHELALPMHQFIFLWNQNIADKPEWFLFISCRGFCPSHYCKLIIMLKCPLCAKRWEGKCPPLIILQEGKCPNPAKNRGGIVLPTWFEQGGKCPGGEMSGYRPSWFILPPTQDLGQAVSSVNSYCTFILEYLNVKDINIISVKLRCLHPMFSLVTLVRGVGGKLSSLVYLAPPPRIWVRHYHQSILIAP